jgi:hypothetical protein
MANARRGEVDCAIGGRTLRLCLTLGALAEIETSLDADGLTALGERLSGGRLSARDLTAILGAAARGGGEAVRDDDIAALPLADDLAKIAAAVGELFRLAFAGDESPGPRPPQP